MQDRYAGDIGDYIKYTLLRRLSEGKRLGVAWYLFPDQPGKGDGRHIQYLSRPERWKDLDPRVFDAMKKIVSGTRSVAAVEASGLLPGAVFAGERLDPELLGQPRGPGRTAWFDRTMDTLRGCDIVFADPDNGLRKDDPTGRGRTTDWKRLPLHEALELAEGRTAIFYHHNARAEEHECEIKRWMREFPAIGAAVRWRRWSSRTFFIANPDSLVERRLRAFQAELRGFEEKARLKPYSCVYWPDA